MIYLSFKSVILDNECELRQVGGWFCVNSELGNQGGRRLELEVGLITQGKVSVCLLGLFLLRYREFGVWFEFGFKLFLNFWFELLSVKFKSEF